MIPSGNCAAKIFRAQNGVFRDKVTVAGVVVLHAASSPPEAPLDSSRGRRGPVVPLLPHFRTLTKYYNRLLLWAWENPSAHEGDEVEAL